MTKTKKVKGGVRLSQLYQGTRDQAMLDFLSNSTYTFLSNSTISCMAVLANLNAGINSNFRSCRSNNLDVLVRQMFVKLMLVDINAADTAEYLIPNRLPHGVIEVATLANFEAEIAMQREIYRTTLTSESSFLDSLCPSIVGAGTLVVPVNLPGLTHGQQDQLNQIQAAVGGNIEFRFIAMEMMEGFRPANVVLPRLPNGRYDFTLERSRYLYNIIQYEFTRFNGMGFFHGDAHFGNVMINPDYPYFSNHPDFLGRAIILDFGRTTRITPQEQALVTAGNMINNINYVYPSERFYFDEPINRIWDLRADIFALFRQHRILYLNTLKPLFVANYLAVAPNANIHNIIDLLREQMQVNYPHLYFEGGQKIENVFEIVSNNNKMENNKMENNKMENNKMENNKMENNKMENNKMENNSKFEIEESIRMYDEFLERFKSHKPDWSEFLKPIKEQLETMDFKEVIGILRDEYDNKYSENVLLTIKPADKKNGSKRNDGGKRKSKKNRKTQKKTK
jgi:hypothetical protein